MSHSAELRTKLVQGIQELESDLDRLRAALAALDGRSSQRSRRRSRVLRGGVVAGATTGRRSSPPARSSRCSPSIRRDHHGRVGSPDQWRSRADPLASSRSSSKPARPIAAAPAARRAGMPAPGPRGRVPTAQRLRRPREQRRGHGPFGRMSSGDSAERVMAGPIYSAHAAVTGGRADGHGVSRMACLTCSCGCRRRWAATASGTNPEQLFAVGYAACFEGALGTRGAAGAGRAWGCVDRLGGQSVAQLVDKGFDLSVSLDVTLPGGEGSRASGAARRGRPPSLPVFQRDPRQCRGRAHSQRPARRVAQRRRRAGYASVSASGTSTVRGFDIEFQCECHRVTRCQPVRFTGSSIVVRTGTRCTSG